MLNSAETVVFPSPIEPPMIERWAIRGASSGMEPQQQRDVRQRADRRDRDRLGMLAQEPGDELDRALGARARRATAAACVVPMPALAVDLGRAHDRAEERARGTLRDRDVIAPVDVQQPERVLRAVADVGVATDRRDGQEVELGPRDGEPDRERVVEARDRCR